MSKVIDTAKAKEIIEVAEEIIEEKGTIMVDIKEAFVDYSEEKVEEMGQVDQITVLP